ncbi:hypothetical protein DL98DRAFT_599901 [Cadophora sp. DSE1049]|nr:hypothetical protein DL98DRAFT_599901 [Cadophora sp. DSE1049]
MLDRISLELQDMVFELIVERRDLKSLCEVSKSFHSIVLPRLYRNIEIITQNYFYENRDIVQPLLSTLICRPSYAQYIKTIHIRKPRQARRAYSEINQYQCEHDADVFGDEEDLDDDGEPIIDSIAEFGSSVLDLLYQLRENGLEGFHWHLDSCTPASLLGENAYLPLKQSRMKSLSITTDPNCWLSNSRSLDLKRFRDLRSVSLTGLSRASDFAKVCGMLLRNRKYLQDLVLDVEELQESSLIRSLTTRESSFHEIPNMFQSLRILCLTGVVFESVNSDAISALNISRLTSLTLNECSEVGEFLTTSTSVAQPTLIIPTCQSPI